MKILLCPHRMVTGGVACTFPDSQSALLSAGVQAHQGQVEGRMCPTSGKGTAYTHAAWDPLGEGAYRQIGRSQSETSSWLGDGCATLNTGSAPQDTRVMAPGVVILGLLLPQSCRFSGLPHPV